jgi:thiamine biosynthesis protein ThiC
MKQHLTSEEISKWIAGVRTAQMEEHARECPQCHAEIVRTEAALSMFRSSVRQWSDRQGSPELASAWKAGRQRFPVQPMRWALIAAALLMLVTIPIYQGAMEKQRRAETAKADALLLEQVDAGVSRAVPQPMEPLLRLVTWDATPKETEEGRRIQ